MQKISKLLLLSSTLLLMSACSSFQKDNGDRAPDSPDYTIPYLA